MSIEEQDQIHGRLMRERSESRRRLVAIEAKVREAAARLTRAASTLGAEPPNAARRDIAELPDKDALLALVNELADEKEVSRVAEAAAARFDRL